MPSLNPEEEPLKVLYFWMRRAEGPSLWAVLATCEIEFILADLIQPFQKEASSLTCLEHTTVGPNFFFVSQTKLKSSN